MRLFHALAIISSLAIAAPVAAKTTPEDIANAILADLKTGDATRVIENLIAQAPLIEVGSTKKANLIATLNTYFTNYGKVEDWQLIRARNASPRFLEQTHIILLEKYAVSLILIYYQSKDGWTLTEFAFDNTKLESLFEAQSMENLEKAIKD